MLFCLRLPEFGGGWQPKAHTVQGVVALCGLVLLVAAIRRSGLGPARGRLNGSRAQRLIQAIGLFPLPAMGAFRDAIPSASLHN